MRPWIPILCIALAAPLLLSCEEDGDDRDAAATSSNTVLPDGSVAIRTSEKDDDGEELITYLLVLTNGLSVVLPTPLPPDALWRIVVTNEQPDGRFLLATNVILLPSAFTNVPLGTNMILVTNVPSGHYEGGSVWTMYQPPTNRIRPEGFTNAFAP